MNKLYIGLGTLIIAVLLTALIAPHFIDWTRYRRVFEQQASGALGVPVRVLGRAEARILPTPTFHFTDVRIGEGEGTATIERFSALIELAPLLRREVNVIQMRFIRPSGAIDMQAVSKLASGELFKRFGSVKVSLSDVRVENGAVTFVSPGNGRHFQGENLNASLDLSGAGTALRMHGGVVIEGEPVMFRLVAGGGTAGARPLSLTFEPASTDLTIKSDGVLLADREGQVGYEGRFRVAHGEAGGDKGAFAGRVEGQFSLTRTGIALPSLKATIGDGIRTATAEGTANIAFGADPRFNARLASRQVDLDRMLGGSAERPVHLADISKAVEDALPWLGIPAMNGNLRIEAEDIVAAGSVIRDVAMSARRIESGWMIDRLSARLPGLTAARMSGFLDLPGNANPPTFDGRADLQSDRPAALIAWINGRGGSGVPQERLSLASRLHIGAEAVSFEDATMGFGDSRASGRVVARRYAQSGERDLTVDVTAEHIDLDAMTSLGSALGVDRGSANRFAFSLEADDIAIAGRRAKGIDVDLFAEGDTLSVRRLAVRDFAGTSLEARGTLTPSEGEPAGRLNAVLKADDFRPAADLLATLIPTAPWLDQLRSNAGNLSPMEGEFGLDAPKGLGGDLELSIDGRLAGTRVNGTLRTAGSLRDPGSLSGTLDLLIAAQDSATLMEQLGLKGEALANAGPARLRFKTDGALASGAKVDVEGELAGMFFDFNGTAADGEAGLQLSGQAAVTAPDVSPALRLAGLEIPLEAWNSGARLKGPLLVDPSGGSLTLTSAFLGDRRLGGRLTMSWKQPAEIGGHLEVSRADLPVLLAPAAGRPIDPLTRSPATFSGGLTKLRTDLSMDVRSLSFGAPEQVARNARFRYRIEPGRTRLTELDAEFAGGRLTGEIQAVSQNGLVELSTSGRLEGASVADLAWRDNGRPVVRGELDLGLKLDARGRSASALVSTLRGSGALTVRDGTALRLNPQAFRSVIRAADAGMELEEERVQDVFKGHLDAGTLKFSEASAGFTVTAGVVRVGSLTIDSASAAAFGSAVADLNAGRLESDWTLGVDVGGSQLAGSRPEVGLVFSGPLSTPARSVDVSPLVGYLTVRSFEREVERIEQLQADISERQRLDRLLVIQRQRSRRASEQTQTSSLEQANDTFATSGASDDEPPPTSFQPAGVEPSAVDWTIGGDGPDLEFSPPLPEAAPAQARRAAAQAVAPPPKKTVRAARPPPKTVRRAPPSPSTGKPLDIRGPTAPAQTEEPRRRLRLRLPSFLRRD